MNRKRTNIKTGLAALGLGGIAAAQVCSTSRISLDSNGTQIPLPSQTASISPDGRFAAFWTDAPLVPQDLNGQVSDIYVVAIDTGVVELLSINTAGTSGNGDSRWMGKFSGDGRFVSFTSLASDLVSGTSGVTYRSYMRDRLLGQTQLVSVSVSGVPGESYGPTAISGDGHFVAFWSPTALDAALDQNNLADVYVHDTQNGSNELITLSASGQAASGSSGFLFDPVDISTDGRFVVFTSAESNLVNGDANGKIDVFRRDRAADVTELVSVGSAGQQSNDHSGSAQCSEDGRFVAFLSAATNLVAADTNAVVDVFVRDMNSGTIRRVSVDSFGAQANAASFSQTSISPDGTFVAFPSSATNLVSNDTNSHIDIFVNDLSTGRTELVSVDSFGAQAIQDSSYPAIARNAGRIVFNSRGPLVAGDTNAALDVYVRDCPLPMNYCTAKTNSLGCVPALISSGVPSASWPSGFLLSANSVLNNKVGILIYSTSGATTVPFHGGTLCIQHPVHRTPLQHSGGSTTGSDCSGTFAADFNAWIASGVDASLVAGQSVWTQYWSRDPGFAPPGNASLTDAANFVIRP